MEQSGDEQEASTVSPSFAMQPTGKTRMHAQAPQGASNGPGLVGVSSSGPRFGARLMHALCCCWSPRWCCCCMRCSPASYVVSSSAANKILPVSSVPTQCDFLQIKPHRRIRVIHHWAGRPVPTNSFPLIRARKASGVEESEEEEEYWFENAAPRRMPIKPNPPSKGHMANRIFNKFEPQEAPRIAGINPPRKNSSTTVATGQMPANGAPGQEASPGARLPRKIILPHDGLELDEEDDDMVINSPRHLHENEQQLAADVEPKSDNIVANALEDMSGLLLNITADSTSSGTNLPSPSSGSEPSLTNQIPEREGSKSPSSPKAASNPKLSTKSVHSDPGGRVETGEATAAVAASTTVIVTGGHLGGMANLAFEAEEEAVSDRDESEPKQLNGLGGEGEENDDDGCGSSPRSSPSPGHSSDETDRSSTHHADAGYHRERDLDAVVADVLQQQQKKNQSHEFTHLSANMEPQSTEPTQSPAGASFKSRPALFFIHGVGGSASTWNTQISYFVQLGYEIIAPDLLGHGFSSVPDNPKSYTFNKLFRDILAIFDHYIAEGRQCVIIAHSYGCSFAAALARTRPSSVIMLLLLASGGPTPLAPPKALKSIPPSMVWCLKPFLRCGFLRQQQHNPRGRQLKFQEAFDVPAYVFRHIMNGQYWPEGDAAFHRRIAVPTLLIYGLKDPFVSLVEMCEMERTIPKAYLELVHLAGHMIMLDQPKELNLMMKTFIEKYTAATKVN